MKRLITLIIILACVSTANAINASNIEWWSSRTGSGLPGDTLKLWTEYMEGRVTGDIGTGVIFYVDSNVSIEGDGSSWTNAYDTLQEAVDASEADGGDNRGDVIKVAGGHAGAIATAAAIDIDVPGLRIEGCGYGEDQPVFSLSANASTFQVSAADVTLYNLRFLSTKTSGGVAQGIDVTADGDGFRMIGCQMRETSADTEFVKALNLTADADECFIVGNRFIFFTGGGDSVAITLEGGSDQSVIAYNQFNGDWSGYVIDGSTAQSLNLLIEGNKIHNYDTSAGKTMAFHATTTGDIIGNKCYGNGSSFAISADAMFVSPDNIAMQTENTEVRNYETMFGAFSGDGGAAQDDSVKASLDLAHTDLDAIKAVTDDLAGISEIGDKVQADMDANSVLYWGERTTVVSVDEITADIMDIQGGPIWITSIVGLVTAEIGGNATTCQLIIDRDDSAADTELTTAVNIESDVVGSTYIFTNANPAVLTPLTPGAVGSTSLMMPWFVHEGMLEQSMSADPGGAASDHITWYIRWHPAASAITCVGQ